MENLLQIGDEIKVEAYGQERYRIKILRVTANFAYAEHGIKFRREHDRFLSCQTTGKSKGGRGYSYTKVTK